ncbi:outer membrane beta-barrel protein [Geomonas sp.]|uniref:outer membrane beta-barrel protein n=1 Tax=Geomonas sp. TaxID=2651584 RepID=UPI002B490824|nr:outer membrane beta-barrel protein [Geomonas sp.]HJV34368.1 outer membrane beta-barrel protein [Geomonas sp.]
MKKRVLLAACALLTACLAGNAAAEDLRGRIAITGRIGVTDPANGEKADTHGTLLVKTDAGIIGGGGLLFGVDDNIALDLEVTRSGYHTSGLGDAGVTDLAIGAQYRLPERQRWVPYAGAGIDVLINDVGNYVVDTVVGLHIKGGVDYMLMRQVALNAEVKGVEAFNADVRNFAGIKVGEFDPSNVSFTIGARYFFN